MKIDIMRTYLGFQLTPRNFGPLRINNKDNPMTQTNAVHMYLHLSTYFIICIPSTSKYMYSIF
jgi:hypothetical protein